MRISGCIRAYAIRPYGFMLFPHPLFLPKKRLPDAAYRCGVASEGSGGAAYRCGIVSEGSGGVMHRYGGIPEASAGAAYRYGSIPEGLAGVMQGCVVTYN